MKTKTAYRKGNIPAEEPANTPEVKIDDQQIQPSATAHVEFTDEADPLVAIDTAIPDEPDSATLALQRQLQQLRESEELQRRQHQAAMQRAQHMTRVEFLQSQGLTKTEAEFFDRHEDMMANQQQAGEAASEALAAGLERDSPEFFQAVEQNFAKRLDALNQRAAAQSAFFAPRSAPSPTPPDRSGMYSAPVSRGSVGTGYREPSPRQVKLTPEEQQIARASGISDVQYAANKLRMLRERASGERQ